MPNAFPYKTYFKRFTLTIPGIDGFIENHINLSMTMMSGAHTTGK